MKGALLGLAALAFGLAFAVPDTHAVHETRDMPRNSRWVRRNRVPADRMLPVRIGLVQSNMDKAHDYLMEVSDPASPKYGKLWTPEQVIEAFRPADDTVAAVKQWLAGEGIETVTHTDNKGWIAFNAPASMVEALLHAKFYDHEDTATGRFQPACDEYHVPKDIQHHIDYITPGVKLLGPMGVQPVKSGVDKRTTLGRYPKPPMQKEVGQPPSAYSLQANLSTCDEVITPACVAALYQIPPGTSANPNNVMGIYESLLQFWDQPDLDLFFSNFYPRIANGTHPSEFDIDGGVASTTDVAEAGGEVTLDLELAYPIVYPQKIAIWDEDDLVYQSEGYEGGFNTWLDAIDGSYCTYSAYGETGDAPGIDPTYPDTQPGGYQGQLQCGVFKPTNVMSVSYGGAEADVPLAYQRRQCNEYLKLGLQGVSFLFASGDAGVGQYPPPYGEGCLGPEDNIFSPNWPVNCPYVTAVGATKVYPGHTVYEPESVVLDYVGHPYAVNYSSGGGFTNLFPVPSYQAAAVDAYFAFHAPAHPYYSALAPNEPNPALLNITQLQGNTGGIYNRIGRGYPDVSANGDNIATFTNALFQTSGGTSAATPIFASIINRINEERLNVGKGPVGFLNPTLYAFPEVLNDITNGTNIGCGMDGFPAVPGWDPSSGLGTPNFPRMLALFLALP